MKLHAAEVLKDLHRRDLRTLVGVELSMRHFKVPSVESIVTYSGLNTEEATYRLSRLNKMKLIVRWTASYVGYALNFHGYDALALDALWKGSHVKQIGQKLAVGKESDLYYALSETGVEQVMKIHRAGRTSFQALKRKRDFTADKSHISLMYKARLSAEREAKILRKLAGQGLPIPTVVASNRHILVLSVVEGVELNRVSSIDEPEEVLADIVEFARTLWRDHGMVHADLSEFNIMITEDGKLTVIDFPQAVPTSHPQAKEIMLRDMEHLVTFFRSKFGISTDPNEVVSYVSEPKIGQTT